MARPVTWARDLHLLREHAARSRAEIWSRLDVEVTFGIGRASSQSPMKAPIPVELPLPDSDCNIAPTTSGRKCMDRQGKGLDAGCVEMIVNRVLVSD